MRRRSSRQEAAAGVGELIKNVAAERSDMRRNAGEVVPDIANADRGYDAQNGEG
jgi:hypothetical protein